MSEVWQILRDAGLPLAIEGTGRPPPTAASLASAVRTAIGDRPTGRDAEALAAFIFAWHHHWPASFAAHLADGTGDALAWAEASVLDEGRYVKLRRIAISNLSHVL